MDHLLLVHGIIAYFVAALAILFVWWRTGRRVMLYVLSLQIVVGAGVYASGVAAPWYHPALGIVAWIGYMVANGVGKRRGETVARMIAGASTLLVLGGYAIGQHAARAAGLH